jgi:hypothetical protein
MGIVGLTVNGGRGAGWFKLNLVNSIFILSVNKIYLRKERWGINEH